LQALVIAIERLLQRGHDDAGEPCFDATSVRPITVSRI
jgi:hypothetical protein